MASRSAWVRFDAGGRCWGWPRQVIVAVLRLPLSAVVLATLLTANTGVGDVPLIIVGVVVAYLITLLIAAPSPASFSAGGLERRTDGGFDAGAAAANVAGGHR